MCIHKHPLNKTFVYRYRYVGDIIACFNGTNRQVNEEFINRIHPKIEFTIEMEEDNKIIFLDLIIEKVSGKYDFSVFHKPFHTSRTIHSTHILSQKIRI